MSIGTQFQDAREGIKNMATALVAHALAFMPGTITPIPEGYTPPPLTLKFSTEGAGWSIQVDYHNLKFVALFGPRQGHELPSEAYIVFTAEEWREAVRQSSKRLSAQGWGIDYRAETDRQANDEMRGFFNDLDADQDGAL